MITASKKLLPMSMDQTNQVADALNKERYSNLHGLLTKVNSTSFLQNMKGLEDAAIFEASSKRNFNQNI